MLPVTHYEKMYVCVAMAMGCAYFSYMVALMVDMVSKVDPNQTLCDEKVEALRSWSAARGLPVRVRERLEESLAYTLKCRSAFDEGKPVADSGFRGNTFFRSSAAALRTVIRPGSSFLRKCSAIS